MIRDHLKVAVRSLRKRPLFTFINVAGLAIGFVCCAFIALYVIDELGYERFHEHADRIVRLVENEQSPSGLSRRATTFGPLAPALESDIPVVAHAVRVLPYSMLVSASPEQRYQEDRFLFVDPSFLEVFSFPLLRGDVHTALNAPNSIVVTYTTAQRYFGNEDPMGQILQVRDDDQTYAFTITGVVQDAPANTHLQFDFLAAFGGIREIYGTWIDDPRNWEHPLLYTYALLADAASVGELEARLPAFAARHMGSNRAATRSLHVERLSDIHLHSRREQEWTPTSDILYVRLFVLIGVLTLLISGVNFVNLSTARATERAREIGMRKVLGARRGELIRQFLIESVLLTTLAAVLALMLIPLLMPTFNALSGKAVTTGILLHWSVPLIACGAIGTIGVLAGIYPALYLSRFRPAHVLKGAVSALASPAGARLRKGLVVFQFAISITLMIGTVVLLRQVNFLRDERLGFGKEHVVIVPLRETGNQIHHESLRQAWETVPGVRTVTASSGMPGLEGGIYDWWVRPSGEQDSLKLMVLTVDHNYAETYGLELVTGRDFSEDHATDASEAYLLNESAARALGWSNPVGKELTLGVWYQNYIAKTGTVVGVVKDFQYRSLRYTIEPIIFHILPNSWYYNYMSVRLRPGDISATLDALESHWRAYNPERPFEYAFLDEQFNALYRSEARLSSIFGAFSMLTIVIACLGLLGLAAFSTERRTKEIGIRKVLGASTPGIAALLAEDLLKPALVAFIPAVPLAYVLSSRWLDAFAYKIELGPGIFALAGLAVLLIASLTIAFQSVRASLVNPVVSLRSE